jgi:hypothetical protein
MTSTPPTANTKTFAPAPEPADNFDRLLAILERNAASVQHEPELARRLREAIRTIRDGRRA